jgi:DNA primase
MFPELARGKLRGLLYFIKCPFHTEKTASFCIYDKTFLQEGFRCYGCGMSGSIIDYYMNRKDVAFVNAVIDLAKIFKIKMKWQNIN